MNPEHTRKCKDCSLEKPETEFYLHQYADGRKYLASYCKPCYNLRAKKYVSENKERVKERRALYRAKNRDSIRSKDRELRKIATLRPSILPEKKVCTSCGVEKIKSDFYSQKTPYGGALVSACKICTKAAIKKYRDENKEIIFERKRKYRIANWPKVREKRNVWRRIDGKKNPNKYRAYSLKRYYGLTTEQYDKMRADQDHKCAICRIDFSPDHVRRNFCVDHDHKTGKIRELLCHQCNATLGFTREDPEMLMKMAAYLTKHKNGN